ncbi:hypothetical protein AC579_9712 [Pseudocercospora musae]|uniref:Uncharacterized protein n=1 Tax=Pseudocercospora musae TaxID=113226 RepID=A0A139I650_9PEZI|nr:hypothetical protein AC579_9712 [Pseudocercospora musae]
MVQSLPASRQQHTSKSPSPNDRYTGFQKLKDGFSARTFKNAERSNRTDTRGGQNHKSAGSLDRITDHLARKYLEQNVSHDISNLRDQNQMLHHEIEDRHRAFSDQKKIYRVQIHYLEAQVSRPEKSVMPGRCLDGLIEDLKSMSEGSVMQKDAALHSVIATSVPLVVYVFQYVCRSQFPFQIAFRVPEMDFALFRSTSSLEAGIGVMLV